MRKFGLIGKSLRHSLSKEYFTKKFFREGINDCEYVDFELDKLEKLPDLIIKVRELCGLNVTNPYKIEVIRYIDEIDTLAESVGAVNCIKIIRDGNNVIMKGTNTDSMAFRETLKPLLGKEHHKALVLGTGGASRAVCLALKELNLDYTLVSRQEKPGTLTYSSINKVILASHLVIINTTPVGMFPYEAQCPPLPYEYFTSQHLVYDLIYNPEMTLFLEKAKDAGARIRNGLEMLHLQADLSWEVWNL